MKYKIMHDKVLVKEYIRSHGYPFFHVFLGKDFYFPKYVLYLYIEYQFLIYYKKFA